MTSATTNTSRGTGGHRGARQGGGLIFFAVVVLLVVGFFNIIEGISAIANSHVFVANAHYVFALPTPRCRRPNATLSLTSRNGNSA